MKCQLLIIVNKLNEFSFKTTKRCSLRTLTSDESDKQTALA